MDLVKQYLSYQILDISLYQYLCAFLFILAGLLLRRLATTLMERLLDFSRTTRFKIDEIVIAAASRPLGWAFVLGGLYGATLFLPVPEDPVNVRFFIHAFLKSFSAIILVWALARFVDEACAYWIEKAKDTTTRLDDQFIPIVRNSSKVFLWMVGGVLFLQNMGYSVTSLIAGLGLGGAAIALASQNTISNVFGSIVIFLDKPFQIGDWVEIGSVEGTVEEVNIRTTRIRTFANSLITMPNSSLTTTAINNWSRMKKRRIKTTLGVTYGTPPEKLEAAVNLIRDLILDDPQILDDFYLVNFDGFGAYSLDIFIYCFTKTTNWAEYLQVKQDFFIKIMKGFAELGVEFAFPTSTVHLEGLPGEPDAMAGERPH